MSAEQHELYPLDFELVRDQYSDRWERANTDDAKIDAVAEAEGRLRSEVVRRAVRAYVQENPNAHEVLE